MPQKSTFEGPLRPGRGEQNHLPPRLRPVFDAPKQITAEDIKRREKNAYNRGYRKGRAVGFAAGYDAGEENARKRD